MIDIAARYRKLPISLALIAAAITVAIDGSFRAIERLSRADRFAADDEFHAPVLLAPGSSVVRRDRVGFAETVY